VQHRWRSPHAPCPDPVSGERGPLRWLTRGNHHHHHRPRCPALRRPGSSLLEAAAVDARSLREPFAAAWRRSRLDWPAQIPSRGERGKQQQRRQQQQQPYNAGGEGHVRRTSIHVRRPRRYGAAGLSGQVARVSESASNTSKHARGMRMRKTRRPSSRPTRDSRPARSLSHSPSPPRARACTDVPALTSSRCARGPRT
jgi:hypothetical protein